AIYYKVFVFPIRWGSAKLYNSFEKKVIEPINIGATDVGRSVSDAFQRLETGVEEEYVLAFGIGLVLLIVLLVIFGQI
ncbi:MAG: hypothetical protein M1368_03925, partial [Thaumarchaeota archaeon]|nr:hypothetical protein [Nitrososphaerota archaeon]